MKHCKIALNTSVTLLVCLAYFGFAKCSKESELMVMAIGHLDYGVYPYALHDDDTLTDCIKRDTIQKHNTSTGDVLDTVLCLIGFSSERKVGFNSIKRYQSKRGQKHTSTAELLDKYCMKWIPKIDKCFEATTSVLNDCDEKERDKGYKSLYFAAAYMSYMCRDKNKTLDYIVRTSESEVSLSCYQEQENEIFACVRSKAYRTVSTDLCTNYEIVKSCYEDHYETISEENCNSTMNHTDAKKFVFSLLKHIKTELCMATGTMHQKMMEQTAAKHTHEDKSKQENTYRQNKSRNNGYSVSVSFTILNLISAVTFTSYASRLSLFINLS